MAIFMVCIHTTARAGLFTSVRNGEWSEGSTWQAGVPPTDGDSIIIRHSVVCSDPLLKLGGDTYIRIDSGAMFCMQGKMVMGCYTRIDVHDMLRIGYLQLDGFLTSDGFIWARDLILIDSCGVLKSTGGVKVGDTFDCSRFYYPDGMNPHDPPVFDPWLSNHPSTMVVYPSPSSDIVSFKLDYPVHSDAKTELIDASGRVLFTGIMPIGWSEGEWRLTSLQDGIYTIRVTDGEDRLSGKAVIIH